MRLAPSRQLSRLRRERQSSFGRFPRLFDTTDQREAGREFGEAPHVVGRTLLDRQEFDGSLVALDRRFVVAESPPLNPAELVEKNTLPHPLAGCFGTTDRAREEGRRTRGVPRLISRVGGPLQGGDEIELAEVLGARDPIPQFQSSFEMAQRFGERVRLLGGDPRLYGR